MKRLIAAASIAVLAIPAFAEVGAPYDQSMVDRTLPYVADPNVDTTSFSSIDAPFDQSLLDRALPELQETPTVLAAAGSTRSDSEIAAEESPWANDYHFIAPAQ